MKSLALCTAGTLASAWPLLAVDGKAAQASEVARDALREFRFTVTEMEESEDIPL